MKYRALSRMETTSTQRCTPPAAGQTPSEAGGRWRASRRRELGRPPKRSGYESAYLPRLIHDEILHVQYSLSGNSLNRSGIMAPDMRRYNRVVQRCQTRNNRVGRLVDEYIQRRSADPPF